MKRTIILSALALFVMIGTASAQNSNTATKAEQSRRSCYVDADNNGKCDKFESGACTVGSGQGLMNGTGRGQGLRDGSGRRGGEGRTFGQGRGKGRRGNADCRGVNCRAGANGRNFVDADNNGVCDRREAQRPAVSK